MSIRVLNSIPTEVPEWCDLFNHPDFFNLHKSHPSHYLTFLNDEKLIAISHFTELENKVFRSPYRGTFGSFNFKPELDLQLKHECVTVLINYLKEAGAKKIEIVSEPFSHDLNHSSALFNAYLNHGFEISNHEFNHSLVVDETALLEKMMRNNKKRLNKCIREGFQFEQVHNENEFAIVYQTIKENREAKGYAVSMSLEQIMEMYRVFPDRVYFFKANQGDVCAASGICIKLNAQVLYVFYWGDKMGFEQFSPVVFLANGIYEFAVANHFKLIDAGTSSLHGQPNFGVGTFKENLGFTASIKLTYSKTL